MSTDIRRGRISWTLKALSKEQDKPFEIRNQTQRCLSILEESAVLESPTLQDIRSELRGWAHDAEHTSSSLCLDSRLRDAPVIADFIKALLDDLERLIHNIIFNIVETVCFITDAVTRDYGDDIYENYITKHDSAYMQTLASHIKNGTPQAAAAAALRVGQVRYNELVFLRKQREEANTIHKLLFHTCRYIERSGVLSRISEIHGYREAIEPGNAAKDPIQQFQEDIEAVVQTRHPKAQESTKTRLVYAALLRRQNLGYWRDRERRINEFEEDVEGDMIGGDKGEAIRRIKRGHGVKRGNGEGARRSTSTATSTSLPASIAWEAGNDWYPTMHTSTSADGTLLPWSQLMKPQLRSAASSTPPDFPGLTEFTEPPVFEKYELSSRCLRRIDKLLPPAPGKKDGREYEKCPYCFRVCRSDELQGASWREHITRDLMPYVCLLGACSKPDTIFGSFKEWVYHMVSQHPTKEWSCDSPEHYWGFQSKSRDAFEKHIREEHPGQYEEEAALAEHIDEQCLFADARTKPLTECPLCMDALDTTRLSTIDILSHVAEHLISLARLSLPPGLPEADGAAWGNVMVLFMCQHAKVS